MKQKRPIVLGSASPRRKELLESLGINFRIATTVKEEHYPSDLSSADIPLFLSEQKADFILPDIQPEEVLITSDTVVELKGKILGKPKSEEEAIEMISALSGNSHYVHTAFTVVVNNVKYSACDTTEVVFNELSPAEISYYVANYKPFDKAGAYGVQEYLGAMGIHTLKGSFYTVMGLPTHLVYNKLKELEIIIV